MYKVYDTINDLRQILIAEFPAETMAHYYRHHGERPKDFFRYEIEEASGD